MTDQPEPTALADLFHRLVADAGLSPHRANQQIDAYAHQLAQQIRNTPAPNNPDDYWGFMTHGADWAADLIDPQTQR